MVFSAPHTYISHKACSEYMTNLTGQSNMAIYSQLSAFRPGEVTPFKDHPCIHACLSLEPVTTKVA